MQRKEQKFVSLSSHKAYTISNSLGNAIKFSAVGFGATDQLSKENSLYILGIVEAISATLALIVLTHETVETAIDWRNFSTGRSLYLFFSLAFILVSYVGASLVIDSAATEEPNSSKALIGTALIALSMFGAGALRGPNAKKSPDNEAKNGDIASKGKERVDEESEEDEEEGMKMRKMKKHK